MPNNKDQKIKVEVSDATKKQVTKSVVSTLLDYFLKIK